MTKQRTVALSMMIALVWALSIASAAPAAAGDPAAGGTFVDDDGSVHEGYIEALAALGDITGCNPPHNDIYCGSDPVTRAQAATLLTRALDLPIPPIDVFTDDDGSIHEPSINAIAAAGIANGCNPPANDEFCPDRALTRGEMAALLARAFGIPGSGADHFTDDEDSIFKSSINAIAEVGITLGCNPPANDRYCPTDHVTREQMASFLGRAVGVTPTPPPPRSAAARTAKLIELLARDGFMRPSVGTSTEHLELAVMAFHKEIGVPRTDTWQASDWSALASYRGPTLRTRTNEPDRIEINLTKQVLYLLIDDEVTAIIPISSGRPGLRTPTGDFALLRHISGWRLSGLGWLYKPWYFYRGFAVHGSNSVPAWPASHGCVRVPNWDADWLEGQLSVGLPVHIWY